MRADILAKSQALSKLVQLSQFPLVINQRNNSHISQFLFKCFRHGLELEDLINREDKVAHPSLIDFLETFIIHYDVKDHFMAGSPETYRAQFIYRHVTQYFEYSLDVNLLLHFQDVPISAIQVQLLYKTLLQIHP